MMRANDDVAPPHARDNPYPEAFQDPAQGISTDCAVCGMNKDGSWKANGNGQAIDDWNHHQLGKKHKKNMDLRSGRVAACQARGVPLMRVYMGPARMLHHCLTCSLDPKGKPRHSYVDITSATINAHWHGRHHTRRVYDLRRAKYQARHANHAGRFANEVW